jgi:hypothetical protein
MAEATRGFDPPRQEVRLALVISDGLRAAVEVSKKCLLTA